MQQFGHWAAIMLPLHQILSDLPAAALAAMFLMAINTMIVYTNRTLESETETETERPSRSEREQNPDQTREEFIMEFCRPVNISAADLRGKPIEDINGRTGEVVPDDVQDVVNQLDTYSPTLFGRLEHTEMSYMLMRRGYSYEYAQKVPYIKTNEDGQPFETSPFTCLRCKAIQRNGNRCINIIRNNGDIFCGRHKNMRVSPREAQGWAVDRDGLVFDDTNDGNVSDTPTEEQEPEREYVKHNLRF
jgi:hypothetical protein